MADTLPNDPAMTEEGNTVDAATRLAHLTRPSGLPLFGRREPTTAGPTPDGPRPSQNRVIGQLTKISAQDLWVDDHEMARWIASTPGPLAEAVEWSVDELALPDANLLIGTGADGGPICVVCETGPSSDAALGVLMRVAAVQDGGGVAWAVGSAGDAHVAAISWLNRSTAPRFFLVTVTGIRIDDSAAAPIFDLTVRPPRASDIEAAGSTAGHGGAEAQGGSAETAVTAAAARPTADASDVAASRWPRRRVEDHVPEG